MGIGWETGVDNGDSYSMVVSIYEFGDGTNIGESASDYAWMYGVRPVIKILKSNV